MSATTQGAWPPSPAGPGGRHASSAGPGGRHASSAGGAPVAAIDCGTNSTRLLVAEGDGRALLRRMHITRLGQGVDRTGALAPQAVERTLGVLRSYRADMDRLGVGRVRATATSAARDAANRDELFVPAEEAVGARLELLSGEEEGRLSFAGATAELDPGQAPYLVVDIGGGSTEVVLGPGIGPAGPGSPDLPRPGPIGIVSLDVGCVRVSERWFHHDPPQAEELVSARAAVRAELEEVRKSMPGVSRARALVGLAGTVATLAAMAQGMERYDRDRVHHFVLSRSEVERLLALMAAEGSAARRQRPGLEAERADVIVGGAVVLAEIMAQLGFERCLASEADILDGLVATLLDPAAGGDPVAGGRDETGARRP